MRSPSSGTEGLSSVRSPLTRQRRLPRWVIGAVACAALAALPAPRARGAERFFSGGEPFAVPPASSLVTGDFNRDGRVDIPVAHGTRSTVSVLLGHSETVLGAAASYETGLGPSVLVAGDLDRDGSLDLFALNRSSSSARVLRGRGDGTFEVAGELDTGPVPRSAVLADLDADGALDAATANDAGGEVRVHFGDGQGGFRPGPRLTVGGADHDLVAGDLDGDGHVDLVDAHRAADGTGRLGFLGGRGDGTFEPLRASELDALALAVVAVSVDGRRMLAVLAESGLSLLDGVAAGSLETRRRLAASDGERFIAPLIDRDVDGDGQPELLVIVETDGEHSVRALAPAGVASFSALWEFPLGPEAPSLADVADVDGDGRLDLLRGVGSRAGIVLHRGVAPGSFAERRLVPAAQPASSLERIDLNADGAPDFFVRSSQLLAYLEGDRRGGLAPPVSSALPLIPGAFLFAPALSYRDMVPLDIDGDGAVELALSAASRLPSDPGKVIVAFLEGSGAVAETTELFFSAGRPGALGAADFNGDAIDDLVIADEGEGALFVLFGSAVGLPFEFVTIPLTAPPGPLLTADFDGDGAMDILVGTALELTVLSGDGNGDFEVSRLVSALAGVAELLLRDVDGDGATDVVARASDRILILNSARPPEDVETLEVGDTVRSVDARDLDGDARLELAVVHGEIPLAFRPYERDPWNDAPAFWPYEVEYPCRWVGFERSEHGPNWKYNVAYEPAFVRVLGDAPPGEGGPDLGIRVVVGEATGAPGDLVEVPIFASAESPLLELRLALELDPEVIAVEAVDIEVLREANGELTRMVIPRGGVGHLLECVDLDGDGNTDTCTRGQPHFVLFRETDERFAVVSIRAIPPAWAPEPYPGPTLREIARLRVRILDDPQRATAPIGDGEATYEDSGFAVKTATGGHVYPYDPDIPYSRASEVRGGRVTIAGVNRDFIRGDANSDGGVDLGDAVMMLNHLFVGGGVPACLDAADADDSGGVEMTDAVFSLGVLFGGAGTSPLPRPPAGATRRRTG